ncbi:polyphenol oxidase I, chloroplastic-like [Triticum dicoccoides]|uniref:polyphenol oxidase I, chloroplastic-like n=1 Tax=Triticum dicoccoides TaxID=85692 RepID=UPI00188E0CDB|nr:polyphenol oxidase I, chloroplastic-like [Triticum dicoccoides]
MACSRGACAPLAVAACVFLVLCAVATVVYTSSSLSTALLAVSGLRPYIASLTTNGSGGTNVGGSLHTSLHTCRKPKLPPNPLPPFYCCPPASSSSEPINFTLPDPVEPLRVRRPVHGVGAEYMAKYERAIALMKALPHTDPRSFYQMANIHCAYCTGSYRQTGNPELDMQIHFSWFFFPFHRAYLYFFERIAAKLLGEPDFALPFWSWDVPEGMRMPPEFANSSSPLYDPVRNPRHAPPRLVDLGFVGVESNRTDEQQIQHNLRTMYKQMIGNAALPSLFHGQPFRAGQFDKPGPGTVELSPHNTVHTWTGDIALTNVENMGTYYSAGRDPLFYPHHSNIDRLWEAWRQVGAAHGYRGHVDFVDPDWLDSSFLFYDEESRLVRITVRDVLDTEKLRYKFDGVGMPWVDARPPTTPNVSKNKALLKSVRFPLSLHKVVTVEVRRLQVLRSTEEKEAREEVLVIEGIETDGTEMVKFDVYVNAMEHKKVEPSGRELAGSYMCLSHPRIDGTGKGMIVETSMRVALNELLEDLDADGDETVTVTLVPRHGKVKIRSLRIVYMVE